MIRSFVLMGAAMLAVCIAIAVPAGAADRMHDPGLHAISVSAPDQVPVYSFKMTVAQTDSYFGMGAVEIRSPVTLNPDRRVSDEQAPGHFIEIRMRC